MLEKIKKILKLAGCLVIGTVLVIKFPVVATGFVAVYAGKLGRNEYESCIIGAIASVFTAFLLLNAAEVAVLATVLPINDLLNTWAEYVRNA